MVEVLWNTVTGVLNHRLRAEINFHDTLYGLRTGRCIRTTSLEVNLILNLTAIREEVLYKIFLYLHKAYDDLDHGFYLAILAAYGVAPLALSPIWRY